MDSVTMLANLSRPTPGMKDFLLPAGLGVGRGELEGPRQDSGLELCLMTLLPVTEREVRGLSATLEVESRGLLQTQVLPHTTLPGFTALLWSDRQTDRQTDRETERR